MQRRPLSRATSAALLVCLVSACSSPTAKPKADDGWRELFDGKTLAGWTPKGGHYDGSPEAWTVEDGAITGRETPKHEGGLLYTTEKYADFEFECDCKCDWPFDSGIFVRMEPKLRGAQVTIDFRQGGEMCAIYSDGFLMHNASVMPKFKRDEWNHFKVRCTGADMHIVTWLNGEQMVDFTIPPGTGEFAREGLIGIQVHGGSDSPPTTKVQFKNLRVKRL
jgi:hypothetical protein